MDYASGPRTSNRRAKRPLTQSMAQPPSSGVESRRTKTIRLQGGLFLAAVASTLLLVLGPVDAYADSNLLFHMDVQHVGLVFTGAVATYSAERLLAAASTTRPRARSFLRGATGLLRMVWPILLLGAAATFVFWHVPYYFDLAVKNESVHAVEHLLFILSGGLIVEGAKGLSPANGVYLFALATTAMLVFGGYMVFDAGAIYTSYPASQQSWAGAGMLAEMVMMGGALGAYRMARLLDTMERRNQ